MLQQFLHTLLVSTICITWGIPVLLILHKNIVKDNFWFQPGVSFLSFLFFAGCIAISFLSGLLCLFAPLHFMYLLMATILLILYLLLFKRKTIIAIFPINLKSKSSTHFSEYIYIALCIILFIALGSMKPINFDTQIYHLQIIGWQAEYGTVPGIANLFPRFGQGSNWFNIISLFHLPFLQHTNFAYVNISFVIWFFLWLFSKWKFYSITSSDSTNNKILACFYFLLFVFFMLDWQLYRDAANSTNYDFPVTSFIIVCVAYYFEGILNNETRNYFSPIFILFTLTIVSFKFSGIFILLLSAYHLITTRKLSAWVTSTIMGLLIVVPVLVKNYIVTGYPFFPHPFSINSPDWQLPIGLTSGNYWYILNYNRFFNFWFMIDKVKDTIFNWVPFWFRGIQIQHKIILFLALSSLILLFIKPKQIASYNRLRIIILILLLMIAGWFFTAPDPGRFGYGPLLSATFITISLAIGSFIHFKAYRIVFFILPFILALYIYKKTFPVYSQPQFLVYPISTESPVYKTIYVKGIGIHLPEIYNNGWDRRCFNTVLPCITQENPYLQPRGKELKDGFKMSEPDSLYIKNYVY